MVLSTRCLASPKRKGRRRVLLLLVSLALAGGHRVWPEHNPRFFIVTIDSSGGDFYEGKPTYTQVAEGQGVDVLQVVVRQGYLLSGWNTHPDGSGDVFDNTTIVYESMTVFAMWEPLVEISVHVDADHGMVGAQVVLRSNQGRFVPPMHQTLSLNDLTPIYDEIVISAPGLTRTMVSTGVDFYYFDPGWGYPRRQIGILPGTNVWIEITDLDPALAPFFEVSVSRSWMGNHDYITPGGDQL